MHELHRPLALFVFILLSRPADSAAVARSTHTTALEHLTIYSVLVVILFVNFGRTHKQSRHLVYVSYRCSVVTSARRADDLHVNCKLRVEMIVCRKYQSPRSRSLSFSPYMQTKTLQRLNA